MLSLVKALQSRGFSVQLSHVAKETSWESHGFVALREGGELLARDDKLQHNREMRNLDANVEKLAEKAAQALRARESGGHKAAGQKPDGVITRLLRLFGRPQKPRASQEAAAAA